MIKYETRVRLARSVKRQYNCGSVETINGIINRPLIPCCSVISNNCKQIDYALTQSTDSCLIKQESRTENVGKEALPITSQRGEPFDLRIK